MNPLVKERVFDRMRLCIISPISRIEPRWVQSVVNMVAYSWRNGLKIYEFGMLTNQVVHWARNELVTQALEMTTPEGPYTHFMFLDSDHVFPADLACRLANNFEHPEVDMISAVYYARAGRPLPIVFIKDHTRDNTKYTHFPIVHIPDGLCQVDAVGFGAIIIKREVFEALPEPRFRFDGCGEDVYFCVNAKEKGFRVFVDGSVRIGHIKDPEVVDHGVFLKFIEEHGHELGEKIRIQLGGGENHGTDIRE